MSVPDRGYSRNAFCALMHDHPLYRFGTDNSIKRRRGYTRLMGPNLPFEWNDFDSSGAFHVCFKWYKRLSHDMPIKTEWCKQLSHDIPIKMEWCKQLSHHLPINTEWCKRLSHHLPINTEWRKRLSHDIPINTEWCKQLSHHLLITNKHIYTSSSYPNSQWYLRGRDILRGFF